MTNRYLGIPQHTASWTFLWIFYVMLAVVVSLILSFTRPMLALHTVTTILPTGESSTEYLTTWWKYGANLSILLVVLIGIPLSLRYFARRMHRKHQPDSTDSVGA